MESRAGNQCRNRCLEQSRRKFRIQGSGEPLLKKNEPYTESHPDSAGPKEALMCSLAVSGGKGVKTISSNEHLSVVVLSAANAPWVWRRGASPSPQALDYCSMNVALGVELRTSHIPGKPSTTKPHPQPSLHVIETESH